MTSVVQGQPVTLLVQWHEYPGGPPTAVTGVQIEIEPVAGGAPVVGPTAVGVGTPGLGVNAYTWSTGPSLAPGDYLVTWTGVDAQAETVTALEVVAVTGGPAGAYTSLARLRKALEFTAGETGQDELLLQCIEAASRGIDDMPPGRPAGAFLPPAAATVRVLSTRGRLLREGAIWLLLLGSTHEIAVETDLVVEYRVGAGWAPWPGWSVEPPDPGDPITVLRAASWPCGSAPGGADLRVTARWGWPALPAKIAQAALIQAQRLYKRRTTPEGVAGSADWGGVIHMARLDPDVAALCEAVTNPGFA